MSLADRQRRLIRPARRAGFDRPPPRLLTLLLTCCLLLTAPPGGATPGPGAAARTYEFINGQWFNGKGFRRRTFYSVDGVLTEKAPPRIDEVVDLQNGFAVPPFGEAPNHNVERDYNLKKQTQTYLKDGIFYVKIPNSLRSLSSQIKDKVNLPQTIDVSFSGGGVTASGGHPVKLYEEVLIKNAYRGVSKEWFNDRAFYLVDVEADVEKKWSLIKATRPDFIKTYLLYSEEFAKRRDEAVYYGRRGLDPKLLPLIVARAHGEGLRVTTHVETATDFHHAVAAGVDEISHLPGYNIPASQPLSRYQISEQDARLAARKGIFVVTTTVLTKFREKDPTRLKLTQDNQIRNLRLLKKHGVKLAVGSDNFSVTSLTEAMNLYELKVFDNLTLLKIWCETTPQTIFPRRKLGFLKQGYEANFLVLRGNPLEDFEHVKAIRTRFKQGYLLTPADVGSSAEEVGGGGLTEWFYNQPGGLQLRP
jgi:Amidohydrolase family